MRDTRSKLLSTNFPSIFRDQLQTLQVNLGYLCNLSCTHCHVNAGPKRKELMSTELVELVFEFMIQHKITTLDLTGGAPEMHPEFQQIVLRASHLGIRVIDRCNLVILEEPGYEALADFLAQHSVEIIASLPCYEADNVDKQRGNQVFERSISALKKLNALGYGKSDSLQLNLVYNPIGPFLPPEQSELQQQYKTVLYDRYGIVFNSLFALCNMPIQRFGSQLLSKGIFTDYMSLLKQAHNPNNLSSVMCRSLLSVDWQGYVYDCDFNQMLAMPIPYDKNEPVHLSDILTADITKNPIRVAEHCFGCTAGAGSSCGGALET